MSRDGVLVVVGVGGMGLAIAQRAEPAHTVLVADVSADAASAAAEALRADGREATSHRVDVSDPAAVQALAEAAATLGPIRGVAHTAGLSPVQASAERVIDVDLLGVAHALASFAPVMAPGGAGVVIASMSGHMIGALPPEDEAALFGTPADALGSLPCVQQARAGDPGLAYAFAKRATHLLVRAAAGPWGEHRARINSISPGIIATPMGEEELAGPFGDGMRQMVEASALGRVGTADEIAGAATFLLGPDAGFITGTDLLVDGGVIAAVMRPG